MMVEDSALTVRVTAYRQCRLG